MEEGATHVAEVNTTDPQHAAPGAGPLGERLQTVIASMPSGHVTLAEIRDLVGQDGLLVLAAFLTLVFMVPVSIPGVSTVFGAAILLIGGSRLLGRNLWLPRSVAQRALPADRLRAVFLRSAAWLHRLEFISRPGRMGWLLRGVLAEAVHNWALVVGALLLMAPFGLVPFSNTLPALALLFLAIGLLQRDGLCILFGHLLNLATVVYFVFLIALVVGGGVALQEALRRFVGGGP
jgi:hypothetical protein